MRQQGVWCSLCCRILTTACEYPLDNDLGMPIESTDRSFRRPIVHSLFRLGSYTCHLDVYMYNRSEESDFNVVY